MLAKDTSVDDKLLSSLVVPQVEVSVTPSTSVTAAGEVLYVLFSSSVKTCQEPLLPVSSSPALSNRSTVF